MRIYEKVEIPRRDTYTRTTARGQLFANLKIWPFFIGLFFVDLQLPTFSRNYIPLLRPLFSSLPEARKALIAGRDDINWNWLGLYIDGVLFLLWRFPRSDRWHCRSIYFTAIAIKLPPKSGKIAVIKSFWKILATIWNNFFL